MSFASNSVVSNIAWRFCERLLAQFITFAVSVTLARLLMPSDFGDIAILLVFTEIINVFVVEGFSTALIQKKNADNIDFSSVFYFGILFSLIVYGIFYFLGPYINIFFRSNKLCDLFRLIALNLPLTAILSVQHAFVQREMQFKKLFYSTLSASFLSGSLGIIAAYNGLGAYAIVVQILSFHIFRIAVLAFIVKWRPVFVISLSRLKKLFDFGCKMFASSLLNIAYSKLSTFVIASKYTAADLAFYDQGRKMPGIVATTVEYSINSVMFPAMAKVQDDKEQIKLMLRKSTRMSAMLIMPLMAGLLVMAAGIINMLYSSKWLPCTIFMQITCLSLCLISRQVLNQQALKAIGAGNLYLKLETIKKVYGVAIILLTMSHGMIAIALGVLSQIIFATIVDFFPNRKIFNYAYKEQIQDFGVFFILASVMGAVVYSLNIIKNSYIAIPIQVFVGAGVYIFLVRIFCRADFDFTINIIKKFIKR